MPTKSPFLNSYAAKLALWLSIITITLLAVHFSLQALNLHVYHQQNGFVYELSNRFDLDDEVSVPTWFSQALFLVLGALALLTSKFDKKTSAKRLWWIIGTGALLAAIDEVAGLHEFILQSIHNVFLVDQAPTALANAWLIVLPLILVVAGWLLYKMVRTFDNSTVTLFGLAIFVFLIGAVGIDLVTSTVERESFMHQGVLVGLEESLELFSMVILIYAVARYLEVNYRLKIAHVIKALK